MQLGGLCHRDLGLPGVCGARSQGEKSLSCLGIFVSGCAGVFFLLKWNFIVFCWHFSDYCWGLILFSELVGKMCFLSFTNSLLHPLIFLKNYFKIILDLEKIAQIVQRVPVYPSPCFP